MHTDSASICILTLNKLDVTERVLRTLVATDLPRETQLILVDNGSSDGTPQRLLEFQRTHGCPALTVTVLLNATNRGCAGGRNQAAALATQSHLVFIDNDIELHDSQWLRNGLDFMSSHGDVGVAGGKLMYADEPRRLQSTGVRIDRDGGVRYIGDHEDPQRPEHNVCRDVQGVPGACFFIARRLFHEAGGFDEAFNPVNYEDLDLCYRVRQRAYRVVFMPTVAMLHRAHTTTHRTPELAIRRVNVRNQRIFRERWAAVLEAELAASPTGAVSYGETSAEEAGAGQSQGFDRRPG